MAVYAVYEPPKEAPDLYARADNLAFVKEGFSWPALFVPLLWLTYQRMWIELILLTAIFIALPLGFGTDQHGQALAGWASIAITVLFAFEANDLRATALERRGYRLAGVASGGDRSEAERSFFTAWIAEQRSRPSIAGERGSDTGRANELPAPVARSEGEEVIGLFPRP